MASEQLACKLKNSLSLIAHPRSPLSHTTHEDSASVIGLQGGRWHPCYQDGGIYLWAPVKIDAR
eukprot:1154607-Pelagomonas_calceolata.AAC.6